MKNYLDAIEEQRCILFDLILMKDKQFIRGVWCMRFLDNVRVIDLNWLGR